MPDMTTDRAREVLEEMESNERPLNLYDEEREALTLALASMEREGRLRDALRDAATSMNTARSMLFDQYDTDRERRQDVAGYLGSRHRAAAAALNPAGGEEVGDGA